MANKAKPYRITQETVAEKFLQSSLGGPFHDLVKKHSLNMQFAELAKTVSVGRELAEFKKAASLQIPDIAPHLPQISAIGAALRENSVVEFDSAVRRSVADATAIQKTFSDRLRETLSLVGRTEEHLKSVGGSQIFKQIQEHHRVLDESLALKTLTREASAPFSKLGELIRENVAFGSAVAQSMRVRNVFDEALYYQSPAIMAGYVLDDLATDLADAQNDNDPAISAALERIADWIKIQAHEHPIIFAIVMSLIFQIVWMAIDSAMLEQADNEALSDDIVLQFEQLIDDVEQMKLAYAAEHGAPVYEVRRNTHLRAGGSTSFQSLRLLVPGEMIEFKFREGDWINVRFFDSIAGQEIEGWVWFRNVARIGD